MSQMMTKIDTSVTNLKKYFAWFDSEISTILNNACEAFWKLNADIKLFSLEKNSKNFFSGNKYFVSQASIHKIEYSIRLSETACNILFTKTLGTNDKIFFNLADMTELEVSILNSFNNIIFKAIEPFILSAKEIKKLLEKEETFENYINLGFIFKNSDGLIGKIFISLPEKFVKFPELQIQDGILDTTKFKKAKTPVDIFVGKTKLSLDEINNMGQGDIVVLEQSNINKMAIQNPMEMDFNVNPDPRLFVRDDNNDIYNMEDIGVSTKDIWNNVQVDVCAKFPKVKMSLGELREMTAGVVMELDSLYGNEVVLEVENRNVAKGELVIVGHKYGVKITEIFDQPEEIETTTDEIEVQEDTQNEDFDVKDFEIEE